MPHRNRLYSWLLNIYPARFREEYKSPMEHQFLDEYRDASSLRERLLLWVRSVIDIAASAPPQILSELKQDLRHSIRVYRGRAFSPIMAVVALALAIGASTGVFSVLNALLFRSLPFSDPRQLVELRNSPFGAGRGRAAFAEWRRQSLYLQNAAAFSMDDANLMSGRDALRVKVAETSANFFQMLGTAPAAGRTFSQGEDAPGGSRVAVISHSLWQQSYGGAPGVIGSVLHLDGAPFTIIGVAPPQFDYPGKANIWTPTVFDFETIPKRGAFLFQTVGRLKPGVSIARASEMFEADVRHTAPDMLLGEPQNRAHLVSLQAQLSGPVSQAGWVLAGMIFLVLLTACANVAQLLLSRTTERTQELAVRAALGASRARLIQQLVTEATALTTIAAALGLIAAWWTANIVSSVAPPALTTQAYTLLDWRVIAFAVALALVMGIVFGVLPALLVGRLQPSGHVVRSQSTSGARRARAVLVALQAGLTLILVASSITMGRTFLQLLHSDLGFQTAHVVTLNGSLQGSKHRGSQAEWQYYSAALDRLRAVPGVQSAGAVSYLPLAPNIYMAGAFQLDSGQQLKPAVLNGTMPGYFQAMGTTFLAGHDFGHTGIIVNQAFAENTGLGLACLGHRVKTPWRTDPYRIVGIVKTTQYPGGSQIYWPVEEDPAAALTLVARVPGDAAAYLARCRDAVRALDPEVPIYDVMTLDQRLAIVLARPSFYTSATLFLAMLALLLAVAGIYGTAANSVAQRTHEVGIRIALGASYNRVRTMMLRENAIPIAVGLLLGVGGTVVVGRFLEHLLENAQEAPPPIFLAAAGLLLFVGLAASWIASGQVLAIEPAVAVRSE